MNSTANANVFVGVDVGATDLVVVLRKCDKPQPAESFPNTPLGHKKLLNKLLKLPSCTVCLEATGVYSMDFSIALCDAKIPLMVVNPKASHNFGQVLLKNSKTDNVDAASLAEFAQRMPFEQWTRPSNAALTLRSYARRLAALTKERAANKNQLHAMSFGSTTPRDVLDDLDLAIKQLDERIESLMLNALAFVKTDPEIDLAFSLLLTVKGIGQTSAIALLGELLFIPKGLSAPQWVKHAGLDPKHFRSGSSIDKKARISKAGNHYIRAALFMPAMSAKTHDPHVKAYFDHLIDAKKTPLQGICAVMRKLIHAIHGMLTHSTKFDNTRFYKIPEINGAKTAEIA